MSRIGKQPIAIPEKTEVSFVDGVLTAKGPNGTLSRTFGNEINISVMPHEVVLKPAQDTLHTKALWGTYAAHINNMIKGVTEGYTKRLQIEGVGYKAELKGNVLVLSIGFSHQVELPIPEGVTVSVVKNIVIISGADKESVGQFAATTRAVRKPEPYKGKGIRYEGEYIIRKQGKRAV